MAYRKINRERKIQFLQFFTHDERELLARETFEVNRNRVDGEDKISQNDFVIRKLFKSPRKALDRLKELRTAQMGHTRADIFGRDLARRLDSAS